MFHLRGLKPWSPGYQQYRIDAIKRALDTGTFSPVQLPRGYGFRLDERIVEYPWLLRQLARGDATLLDAGSALNHDFLLSRDELKSKDVYISTLAPEPVCFWRQGVSYVFEDFRRSCFRDNFFDIIASISTIEHIGMDNTKLYTSDDARNEYDPESHLVAIREFRRLLKPGGTLFLSFPFGAAANHGWYQVFDAEMVSRVISNFAPASVTETYFQYLPYGWTVSTAHDARNATSYDVHTGEPYGDDFAAADRAIVCLEMVS